MTIQQRMLEKTPRFFRKLRNIGLALVAVSTVILTAPVALPAIVIEVAGYLAVAGGAAAAVSQAVSEEPAQKNKEPDGPEPAE